MRVCGFCGVNIEGSHHNRKYCSDKCQSKARYKKTGQRTTPEQRAGWYRKRCEKEGYRQLLRHQGKLRRDRVQQFLRDYKIAQGCAVCGYDEHHAALEFDHVRGNKNINICLTKSIEQAKKEIKKCRVLCSNHHKIATFERLQK